MPICYKGRGTLHALDLSNAAAGYFSLGGASEVSLSLSEERVTLSDARFGRSDVVESFTKALDVRLVTSCYEFSPLTYGKFINSPTTTIAGGAFNFAIDAPPAFPVMHYLGQPVNSGAVVLDSLLSALSLGVHYQIDESQGFFSLLSATGFTFPLSVSGTFPSYKKSALLVPETKSFRLLFDGINVVNNAKLQFILYNCGLELPPDFNLLTQTFSKVDLSFIAFASTAEAPTASLSNYGEIQT